jgi:hypothetical protein
LGKYAEQEQKLLPGRTALKAKASAGRVKMPRAIGLGRRFVSLLGLK